MNAFSIFGAIEESPLYAEPIFPVEDPDGIRCWPELNRQVAFRNRMMMIAPKVKVFAIPNAGKRNGRKARLEGITGGVFDLSCQWPGGEAYPEFKGYTAAGRPGELSPAQVDWGNSMFRMGKHVACFFHPRTCIEWLITLGAPIGEPL